MKSPAEKSGFTLIEILMTIMLIAILARIAITQFTDFSKDAKIAVTRDNLAALKRAIIGDSRVYGDGQLIKPGYIANVGNTPTTLTDLITQPGTASAYDPLTKRGWRGPYVDNSASNWNKDAWGTTLVLNTSGRIIQSYGPNTTNDNCGASSDDICVSY
jgi:prepilin-type N-terminal cleavage/methylation domain-containing protein